MGPEPLLNYYPFRMCRSSTNGRTEANGFYGVVGRYRLMSSK